MRADPVDKLFLVTFAEDKAQPRRAIADERESDTLRGDEAREINGSDPILTVGDSRPNTIRQSDMRPRRLIPAAKTAESSKCGNA